jgi:hypothetical protein
MLITAGAKEALHPQEVLSSLFRHERGLALVSPHPSESGRLIRVTKSLEEKESVVSLEGEEGFLPAGSFEI